MKNIQNTLAFFLLFISVGKVSYGQLGIGTTSPSHPLTVVSTTDPLRFLGLQHNTSVDTLMVIAPNGVVYKRSIANVLSTTWSTLGNSGTSASTNFIGTTDSTDFVIRVNNAQTSRFIAGKRSFHAGQNNNVTGTNSFALGYGDTLQSSYSIATGYDNDIAASADYSATFGRKNTLTSTASYGFVSGEVNKVEGIHGSAFGENLFANCYNMFVVGSFNDTVPGNRNWVDSSDHLFVVGNGHLLCDRSNVITATWGGNVGIDNKDPLTALDVHGGFSLRPRTTLTQGTTTTINADNFDYIVHNRSYLRIDSDDSPSDRSLVLSDGLQVGQIIIIECIATGGFNGVRIVDNTGTHNTNTNSGTVDLYENDIIGMIWNGSDWIMLFNSNN